MLLQMDSSNKKNQRTLQFFHRSRVHMRLRKFPVGFVRGIEVASSFTSPSSPKDDIALSLRIFLFLEVPREEGRREW